MMDLRRQANDEAERAETPKGPMACYWRAVSTYARHVAHVLGHLGSVASDVDKAEMNRLQQELRQHLQGAGCPPVGEAASISSSGCRHPSTLRRKGGHCSFARLRKPRRTVANNCGSR